MTSEDLKVGLRSDFGLSNVTAALATFLPPLALFLFMQRDFVSVVGAIGSVFGGLNGIVIALIAWKMKQQKKISAPFTRTLAAMVMVAYVGGILYQLFVV